MIGLDEERLYRVEEPPLDPGRLIIDPHQHIWTERFSTLIEHFGRATVDDFLSGIARSGHNIVATVHMTIQADYRDDMPSEMIPVAETEYLDALADELVARRPTVPLLASALVAGADMLLGAEIDRVLDAHTLASPDRFKGIRHAVAYHPSPLIPFKEHRDGILLEPAFAEASKKLAQRDLSLDIFVFYNQLPQVVALARAVPDLRIILNHTGGLLTNPLFASEADDIVREWRRSLKSVSECANVVIKLGGLGMAPVAGDRWTSRPLPPTSQELSDWQRPYILYALECFSADRAMFESNFPVDKPTANYGTVWNSFKRLASDLSEEDKRKLFFDNASHTYRMGL
jgi:predicted TIM-barrel fold metal-dependent hydrolase